MSIIAMASDLLPTISPVGINETDRDAAEVALNLQVGNRLYQITRGMFELEELRDLKIYDTSHREPDLISDGSDMSSKERHQEYAKSVASAVGPRLIRAVRLLTAFCPKLSMKDDYYFSSRRKCSNKPSIWHSV